MYFPFKESKDVTFEFQVISKETAKFSYEHESSLPMYKAEIQIAPGGVSNRYYSESVKSPHLFTKEKINIAC